MKYHDSSVFRLDFSDCLLLIFDCHFREKLDRRKAKKMVFFRVKLGTLFFLERMKMGFRERRWRSFLQRRLGKEKRVSLSLFILAKSTNKTSFSFPSIFNYIQNNNVFILFNYEKNLIFFFFSIFSTIFKTILSNNYYKILTLLFWSNLFFFWTFDMVKS